MRITEDTIDLLGLLDSPEGNAAHDILDVGCGSAAISMHLSDVGYNVTAIDVDSQIFSLVKKEYGLKKVSLESDITDESQIHLREESIEEFAPGHRYSNICCFGVLHYYQNDDEVFKCLDKIRSLIVKDGILLLSWISQDSLNRDDAYFPPQDNVFTHLSGKGWNRLTAWQKELTHAHGNLPMHTHTITYSAWKAV